MIKTITRLEAVGERPWIDTSSRLLWPGELDVLVGLLQSVSARRVAEIGVHEGETAWHLLRQVPSIEEYIGVEVQPGYVPRLPQQPNRPGWMALDDPRFRLILNRRGSYDVTSFDLGELDAIFIDGDHSMNGVENDTSLAESCVRRGIVIWHDYYAEDGGWPITQFLNRLPNGVFHIIGTHIVFERKP
jgi:predicted O-methyltransferase YrrM